MTVANSIIYYFCLSSVILATALSVELDSIGEYELIHIDIDNQNEKPIIEFTAFSAKYKIELTPNNQFIPANIRRANGNPTVRDGNVPYYTSQTTSCHYSGALLETNITAIVSASMCPNHGIRVHIHAQTGDVIAIEPTHKNTVHSFTDEHIVYKSSDVPLALPVLDNKRRLAAKHNNGKNYVEILLFFDATLVAHYKDNYASNNWYENLEYEMMSVVNTANNAYLAANWYVNDYGKDAIGEISLHIVEIEVIETHNLWTSGKYAGLKPVFTTDGCSESTLDDYRDISRCKIDANNWLGKIKSWCDANKDKSLYDNVLMLHRIKMKSYTALARAKRMCMGFESVSTNFFFADNLVTFAQTIGHEIGHVLGASTHNTQNSEYWPDIMTVNNPSMEFKQGTVKQITDYFNGDFFNDNGERITWLTNKFHNNGGISCLANEPNTEITVDVKNSICCECTDAKEQGQKGCTADTECQAKICDADTYCCNNHWDQNCANAAKIEAKICMEGIEQSSICCECTNAREMGQKGCTADGGACQTNICGADNYCCDNWWDQQCANAAAEQCTNGGDAAFTSIDCLDNNEYSEYLCVSVNMNNSTIFDGENTLKSHGSCANDRPIWYFTVTEFDTDGRNGTRKKTYYLHYDTYVTLYMQERMSRWIISVDEISTVGVAICEKENLFDCRNGSWIVDQVNDDYVESVIEPTMNIINRGCNMEGSQGTVSKVESGIGRIVALCVLVLICIVVGIGVYICYKKGKGVVSFEKTGIEGNETKETKTNLKEDHEEEIEVDVEVEMET